MTWETISLKMPEELAKKIDQVARMHFETKSDLMRHVIADYVLKEMEFRKLKSIIAERFARGEIGAEKLKDILGKTETERIEVYKKITEESFEEAKKFAKRIKEAKNA